MKLLALFLCAALASAQITVNFEKSLNTDFKGTARVAPASASAKKSKPKSFRLPVVNQLYVTARRA